MFAKLIGFLAAPAIFCARLADTLHILPLLSSERFRPLVPADALITIYVFIVYCIGVLISISMLFSGTSPLAWMTAVFFAYFAVTILLRIVFEFMLLVMKALD